VPINFFTSGYNYTLPQKRVKKLWIHDVITSAKKEVGTINFIFTSEDEILRINKEFLKHNFFTDIITFPYNEMDFISADLYISVPTVIHNAKKFNQTFENELNRVMVHGVLHLIGFDDKIEKDQIVMREQENFWLSKLNIPQ